MEIGKIEVSGNRARVSSRSSVTSGMVGATVAFAFDETWADMDKTLVWAGSGVTVDDTTASGVVPAEVVAKFGGRLKVGVYGTKEGTAIPTVWADLGPILPGADPSGDESTDPSLPVWAQLQQQMGFSPVVAVEDIDGGHRVTITDKDGEKTFDVMDGEDGAVTEEQIASAVEDYMAEHPVECVDAVKTVNGISPDANGNVEIPVSGGNVDQGGGMSTTAKNLLITILRNGVYSTDQSANITALETALAFSGSEEEPDAPTKTLTSISATYSGGDVEVGTAVNNLAGIVVTAHYSDGTSKTVTGYTLSGTIAEGENIITVTYQGMTATFAVTGVAESSDGVDWVSGAEIAYAVIADEYVNKTDGTFIPEPGGYDRTDYIYCYGAKFLHTTAGTRYNAFYDVSKRFIKSFDTSYGGYTEIPNNAAFFACSASSFDGFICKLYKNVEPTWTDGVAYEFTIVENEYVAPGGVDTSYNEWNRTDFVNCAGASKLVSTGTAGRWNFFYNAEKEVIGDTWAFTDGEVAVPIAACYFKLSGSSSDMSNLVITPYA